MARQGNLPGHSFIVSLHWPFSTLALAYTGPFQPHRPLALGAFSLPAQPTAYLLHSLCLRPSAPIKDYQQAGLCSRSVL